MPNPKENEPSSDPSEEGKKNFMDELAALLSEQRKREVLRDAQLKDLQDRASELEGKIKLLQEGPEDQGSNTESVSTEKEDSIEKRRQELADKVKLALEKYKDEVELFSLSTTSKKENGDTATNDELSMVDYKSSFPANEFEFKNLGTSGSFNELRASHKNGYIYDTVNNNITFQGYLGRALHTPLRPGNGFYITMKFKKEAKHTKEIIDAIFSLLDTLKDYSEGDVSSDLKNILKQGIPILEAFEDFSSKLPEKKGTRYHKGVSVSSLLKEYKELEENFSEYYPAL